MNPGGHWEEALERLRQQVERLELQSAEAELTALVDGPGEAEGGPEADRLRLATWGLLAQARFGLGRAEGAREAHLRGLELSRRLGWEEETRLHLRSLFEIERYLGHPEKARHWARESGRDESGELAAPVRLLAEVAGQEYELGEVPPPLRAQANFRFRRNRPTLPLAQQALQAGQQALAEGDGQRALEAFQAAERIDRYDPEPRARAGLVLMQLRRWEEALEHYAQAEQLGPGWFRLATEAWLARELAAGRLLLPAWLALLHLESERSSPAEIIAFASPVLALLPGLAPLRYWHGRALEATGQPAGAVQAYRAAAAQAQEANLKTRALFHQALLSQGQERRELLGQAAALAGHLPAAARATWLLEEQD